MIYEPLCVTAREVDLGQLTANTHQRQVFSAFPPSPMTVEIEEVGRPSSSAQIIPRAAIEFVGKRVELLKNVLPHIRRNAV